MSRRDKLAKEVENHQREGCFQFSALPVQCTHVKL